MAVSAGTLGPSVASAPPAGPRPNLRRLGLPIALIVVVIVGGLAFRQRVLRYDPIEIGPLSYDDTIGTDNVSVDFPGYRAVLVPAVAGKEFRVRWSITNRGDRAVTVTDVPFEVITPYLERARMEIGDGSANEVEFGASSHSYVAFHPFVLEPHRFRELSFTYRFRNCPFPAVTAPYFRSSANGTEIRVPGVSVSWTGQRIRYDVWGIGRSTMLQPRTQIVLVNATGDCG